MKALKIEPGKAPERIDVANELASLQSLVGGYIEVIYPDERRPVGLICNEEGKCCGLELNRALYQNGKPYDIIAGTFLVVGLSAEDCSLFREAVSFAGKVSAIRREARYLQGGSWRGVNPAFLKNRKNRMVFFG